MSGAPDSSPISVIDPSAALLGADVPDGAMELAVAMADAANDVAHRHFRRSFTIEHKADESPVTIADRETESAMRALVTRHFPEHGIFGEEHGHEGIDQRHVWVIDPIDGTASFAVGSPVFGAMIALLEDGVPILGVIECPMQRDRWIGARGRPTTLNGQPVRTRSCGNLSAAWLEASLPEMFDETEIAAFRRLQAATRRTVWGLNCVGYGLIAAGSLDLVCESDLKPYDHLAVTPIIEGAGGRVTTWTGERASLTSGPTILAAGDADVHAAALEALAG